MILMMHVAFLKEYGREKIIDELDGQEPAGKVA